MKIKNWHYIWNYLFDTVKALDILPTDNCMLLSSFIFFKFPTCFLGEGSSH